MLKLKLNNNMILFVIIINAVIRILLGWGMFCSFANGHYFIASVLMVGMLKRNWIVYDAKYDKQWYINIDR